MTHRSILLLLAPGALPLGGCAAGIAASALAPAGPVREWNAERLAVVQPATP